MSMKDVVKKSIERVVGRKLPGDAEDMQSLIGSSDSLVTWSDGSKHRQIDVQQTIYEAEALIHAGRLSEGRSLLALAIDIEQNRTSAVAATLRAAAADHQFQSMIAEGDRRRDQKDWPGGEACYWRALQFYPLHSGYLVQYGHCLKEQHLYPAAEVIYASALALGAPKSDVEEHLRFASGRVDGHYDRTLPRPPADVNSTSILDYSPSVYDVRQIMRLMLGVVNGDAASAHWYMRECATIRDVFEAIIASNRFPAHNPDLVYVLSAIEKLS